MNGTTPARTFHVGVDVGGTFTDVVIATPDGALTTIKVLSTPGDYSEGILDGLQQLQARAGASPAAVGRFIHAFTVATNALLTGGGATVGLITTAGFRDVLEIGRLRMPRLYDMDWDKPRPLVPRRRRAEVRERIDGAGRIVTPIAEDDVAAALTGLLGQGVDSIAVCLLHAYANPIHEQTVLRILARMAPELSVSASHVVLPEIREFERTSTTVVNAFVRPVVDRYLGTLENRLADRGIRAPVMVMQSAGGIMHASAARRLPAQCIESGPAAGAVGAAALGRRIGIDKIISFDMGGTTAKACLIEDGEPRLSAELEVGSGINVGQRLLKGGGYLVRVPTIDLAEIGAGGGSLAWIDRGGALRVGPQSAGASPGPACYGRGGSDPTVTDANVVLGYLNDRHLLDGEMPIDGAAARSAIARGLAAPLGLAPEDAAFGVHAVADATMVRAIRAVSSELGRSPGDFVLVAFGGSGPVHAASLAAAAGMAQIVVPPAPGVFSASGLLSTAVEHRLVQTFWVAAAGCDLDRANAHLDRLSREAVDMLSAEGFSAGSMAFHFAIDLRYAGQSSELTVAAEAPLTAAGIAAAVAVFHRDHETTYGYCSPEEAVQIVNLRLRARGLDGAAAPAAGPLRSPSSRAASERRLYFGPERGWVTARVIDRGDVTESPEPGPLVIEEYDSTVIVPPLAQVWRDRLDNLRLDLGDLLQGGS